MIPVLSRAEMQAFDAGAIDGARVPGLVLMENAGRGAADVIAHELLEGRVRARRVLVVCGAGNNGGDGFVVARHLFSRGAQVEVVLVRSSGRLTPDAATNSEAFIGLSGRCEVLGPEAFGEGGEGLTRLRRALDEAEVVVDALFGTGLRGPARAPYDAIISTLNARKVARVALDVPSGMDADTGCALGQAFHADLTVTFGHLKLGHLTGSGARLSGRVVRVDLGVPPGVEASAAELMEPSDVARWVSGRELDLHKYRAGHVALLAGSETMIGAALLAARGALRGGAGVASLVSSQRVTDAVLGLLPEVLTQPLEEHKQIEEQLERCLVRKDTVVIGPGFGIHPRTREALAYVLSEFEGGVVADADALSTHAGNLEEFREASGRCVLTPHAGELARLLGIESQEVEQDRIHSATRAAKASGCVVLLKGPYSLIASPVGRVLINPIAEPALATAGSGDVLAGLIGASSVSLAPLEAAAAGAYLHGASGQAWAKTHGDRGLLAAEIADGLPREFAALRAP